MRTTTTTTLGIVTALFALAIGGCYQGLSGDAPGQADTGPTRDDGAAGEGGESGEAPGTPEDPGIEQPFEPPTSEVELLPFHVRMANLAKVAGVSTDDAMFLDLYTRRYQLGDHDYANGVAPDLKWSPERMETWLKGIKPVCNDPRFQARYPDLATDPTALVKAAFARAPDDEELAAFEQVKSGQPDGAGQYRMVCLAVLTSLEFVAR
ncbi:MAG: hypothetical protein IPH07_27760 [Deltaproteobacteria bacterium]|nr:hypothetical protein [Deltaproteobacteria bacterium]MBK8233977.1 hypothetical protein [Deltaproteobacteria bacterium]MBK8714694.1 hypothetical protein [Deltaproteobacteria bacterium]MBP7289257.1 hypothetical protein [Nannocystaceae bacterium]